MPDSIGGIVDCKTPEEGKEAAVVRTDEMWLLEVVPYALALLAWVPTALETSTGKSNAKISNILSIEALLLAGML